MTATPEVLREIADAMERGGEWWREFEVRALYSVAGTLRCPSEWHKRNRFTVQGAVFSEHCEIRKAPRTIEINGIEVPEPLREEPTDGTRYYIADNTDEDSANGPHKWLGDKMDQIWLRRGLIHLDRESAEQHAHALILASGGEV